ncbi:hypothetical protein [Chitinophaga sp. CB10]|nr:hypothetical protein [Chitinophaga sp. CB10]
MRATMQEALDGSMRHKAGTGDNGIPRTRVCRPDVRSARAALIFSPNKKA